MSTYTNRKLSAESPWWIEYLSQMMMNLRHAGRKHRGNLTVYKLNQDGNDIVHMEDRKWEMGDGRWEWDGTHSRWAMIEDGRWEMGLIGGRGWEMEMGNVKWKMRDGRGRGE